jgi:hypothetical protein
MAPSARERRSAGLCKAKSPHLQAKVRFTVRRLGRLLMAHSRLAWAHLVAGKYGAGGFYSHSRRKTHIEQTAGDRADDPFASDLGCTTRLPTIGCHHVAKYLIRRADSFTGCALSSRQRPRRYEASARTTAPAPLTGGGEKNKDTGEWSPRAG